ncbi:MAG: DUF559 domain-containing protein [Desulfobulbaceae bacterium]|nr:DUF559 domain-containing protein [Desulfobulbaceae bacterium]MBS4001333.1 DUF559 domain-containing protein [Desulfobulbaceae bacterium]
MTTEQYLNNINKRYKLGNATEHTFRGDLQQLIESMVPTIRATNEPKRQSCGAPDYILTKKEIPIGFIEAKDIGDNDLEGTKKTGNKEQFDRYKASLNNLIFTDYIRFYLYQDGELIAKIEIGEVTNKGIKPLTENFVSFENLIKNFCIHIGQTIKSPRKLAEMMAGKARLLSEIIERALNSDENNSEDSTLKDQMHAFQQILIHDITAKGFADVYAQTIAYGMFAARLHDTSLNSFTRQEAAELIPKSNPFLRKLFGYISGPDIDDRIKWIVDSLADIFLATNVEEILRNYGKATKMEDPIIHFYETFLSEYDPKLRKARGVWYTPQPVVDFIVRAVDDILKSEFDLPQGLADTSKTTIKVDIQGKMVDQQVHKVQILDPATGTGTFLAEVVKHIHKKFVGQQGIWSNYVETHLLPRLNGFELLMASYAMAHLKLDLLLKETGYKPTKDQRFRVFLTNSLEEYHPETGTLFANWLSSEANEANRIKKDTPVMCIIGNPPYSVSSTNKSDWIEKLTADYKKDLNERNIQPLSDDYIKFIRFGQHFIEKNGSGILSYISNNSFIDGIIHRQMRKNLLESFDKIYILDLHGNAKKKEVCPDGSPDSNVFDIMQGVSINLFIKTGKKKENELGKVWHFDLQGNRDLKYNYLNKNNLSSIKWNLLKFTTPNYFFVNKNFDGKDEYDFYFDVSKLFIINSVGVVTSCDDKVLADNKDELQVKIVKNFEGDRFENDKILDYLYRPFENKKIYYEPKFLGRSREKIMQHYKKKNIGLIISKQFGGHKQFILFITNSINDKSSQPFAPYYNHPLYLYPETDGQQKATTPAPPEEGNRIPNLNAEIVNQIAEKLGLKFVPEKSTTSATFPSSGAGNSVSFPSSGGVSEGRGGRNTKNYMELPYNPKLKERAKELRKAGNLSEVIFWNQVKNKQFNGYDFDRQKIIGNYIVDFYCTNCNVVIEIDGSSHDDKQEYDTARDSYLEGLGLSVIHISDIDVKKNLSGVMSMLSEHPALKVTSPEDGNFAPIDILDYIYAVLHSPTYREKYKEFLKIDFPRVPYPKNKEIFWQLVKLGGEIRQIHLLESPTVEKYITQYPINGNNIVEKPRFLNSPFLDSQPNNLALNSPPLESQPNNFSLNYPPLEGCPKDGVVGKVYINDTQYFDNVPKIAWEFYIGGYQPAQKWLKDRKGRELEYDDILHYQKIIVALSETDRIMKEIDKIEIE